MFEAASEITATVTGKPAPQPIFQTEGDGCTESHGPCDVRRLHSIPGEATVRRLRSFVNPPGAGGLGMAVERGEQGDQLFLEVTAKKAAASWRVFLPWQFGHLTLDLSCSSRVRTTSKGFLQSWQ